MTCPAWALVAVTWRKKSHLAAYYFRRAAYYFRRPSNFNLLSAAYYFRIDSWLRYLLTEFRVLNPKEPTTIYTDNKAAITFSHDDQFHARSKHILIRYHITRERIEERVIDLIYVKSEENCADIFTKALARPAHLKQRDTLGMRVEGAC